MFGNKDNHQDDQAQDQNQYGAPSVTDDSTVVTAASPAPDPTPSAVLDESAAGGTDMQLPNSIGLPGNLTTPSPTTDTSGAPAVATSAPAAPVVTGDLLSIKQGALQQLAPLVDHLDQTPEERFRTTMMMIQATDDHTKLQTAYEAAQKITDEKVRAQALLDVVNEINYFTQQHHQPEEAKE